MQRYAILYFVLWFYFFVILESIRSANLIPVLAFTCGTCTHPSYPLPTDFLRAYRLFFLSTPPGTKIDPPLPSMAVVQESASAHSSFTLILEKPVSRASPYCIAAVATPGVRAKMRTRRPHPPAIDYVDVNLGPDRPLYIKLPALPPSREQRRRRLGDSMKR